MKPRLAVFKFASCDGCQLQFLNAEAELLTLAAQVDIAYFPEARSRKLAGPYDIAFVEGSISTLEDARRIVAVREQSRYLVTIGACATAGGIQALRNWADAADYKRAAYPSPALVATLPTSTPISEHVRVDFEIWGCPVDTRQLLAVLRACIADARPVLPAHSVCMECKRAGNVCVVVARGEPCPSDPHRVRRALPPTAPRLLRVLRSRRRSEHVRVHRAVGGAGRGPGGRAAPSARHQRVRASVARER